MSQYLESETFLFFHKGLEIPARVDFYHWKEEASTSQYPGAPEEFEVVSVVIPTEYSGNIRFDFGELISEEFGDEVRVDRFCKWVDGLEQSAIKAFYDHVKNKKENHNE